MNNRDIAALGAGFSNEALESQAVFRAVQLALSHPGRLVDINHTAKVPSQGHSTSAAFFLSMLDADSTLWMSPALVASDAALWLHFHTGCKIVDDVTLAQFVWVGAGDAMPVLSSLAQGSEAYPDQSATCVLDVIALNTGAPHENTWALQGPGIQTKTYLNIQGLASDFVRQWSDNHARFPRGIDIFLAAQHQLIGLPRTTNLALNEGDTLCM
jgi:alpha-D-ribose 1-methylphosphonate 5-triphosphate synthase subunit PhnH